MKETFKHGQGSATQGFGSRLAQERREKAAREQRDIAQKDVAEAVGSSGPSVSRWEAGVGGPPSDSMIERLAAYFGVTPSWLRYGQEPRQPDVPTGVIERDYEGAEPGTAKRTVEAKKPPAKKAAGGKGRR